MTSQRLALGAAGLLVLTIVAWRVLPDTPSPSASPPPSVNVEPHVALDTMQPPTSEIRARDKALLDEPAELAVEASVMLSGIVVDTRGTPVAGATIRALELDSTAEHGMARADADGRFAISGLPVQPYRPYVHSGRHLPRYGEPVPFASPGERREVVLRLEPGLTVGGRVVDPERRPVAGAHVGCSDEGSNFVTTDADGGFELGGLRPGPLNLFVVAQGFASLRATRVAAGTTGVELQLELPSSLTGSVVPARPASQMQVSLCHFDDGFGKELCVARRIFEPAVTEFSLEQLTPGSYDVVVAVEGHLEERVPAELSAGKRLTLPPVRLRVQR